MNRQSELSEEWGGDREGEERVEEREDIFHCDKYPNDWWF